MGQHVKTPTYITFFSPFLGNTCYFAKLNTDLCVFLIDPQNWRIFFYMIIGDRVEGDKFHVLFYVLYFKILYILLNVPINRETKKGRNAVFVFLQELVNSLTEIIKCQLLQNYLAFN